MEYQSIKSLMDIGSNSLAICAIIWLVVYMVKHIIDKMGRSIDKMIERLDKHEVEASKRGEYLRKEHEKLMSHSDEISKALGRINGYKE